MAKLLVRSFAVFALLAFIAASAFAGKGEKKEKAKKDNGPAIKALEEQIHKLHEEEKVALKGLDSRFEHVIKSMDPKEVRVQLEEILVVLQQVRADLGTADDLNFGGNRVHAREAAENAEHQVVKALHHDTWEERAKAAHDMEAIHVELVKGLAFSAAHPLAGKGPDELARRAAANQRLIDAEPRIALAYHVLMAVDHEIKDFKEEKHILHEKHKAARKELEEQFHAKVKALEEEIHALKGKK